MAGQKHVGKSTGNSGKNSGNDKRRENKGRVENLRPWQPGESGNPSGRPKSHAELRKLIQELASEETRGKGKPTRIVVMLRKMLASTSPHDRQTILEHGFGKVPQGIEHSGDLNLLTPEEREAKRAERWKQVAPALAVAMHDPEG